MSMNTQWVHSFGGVVGLNYASLDHVYRGLRISDDAIPDTFQKLQILESETLELISAKRASK